MKDKETRTITCICGHDCTKTFYGTPRAREKKFIGFAKTICDACRKINTENYENDKQEREDRLFARFRGAGTYRQQSARFIRHLDKQGIEYHLSGFWGLADCSRYVYISQDDDEIVIRFADHGQIVGGGFCKERQARLGRADLSCDPTTGQTWRDAIIFLERNFNK